MAGVLVISETDLQHASFWMEGKTNQQTVLGDFQESWRLVLYLTLYILAKKLVVKPLCYLRYLHVIHDSFNVTPGLH